MRARSFSSWLSLLAIVFCATAQQARADGDSPYAPYSALIGSWDVSREGSAPTMVSHFRWGPGKSYIWYATSFLDAGKEAPHFEGMLMWNGAAKNLDMLVALDLNGGRVQEQGTLTAKADGSIVRDIVATYSAGVGLRNGTTAGPEGATAQFRQTYTPLGADKLQTSVMQKTPSGWAPSFPGSDKLIMVRRPS